MTSIPEFCYDVVICNHDKLFETIKEATEYCDHHKISTATIRQFERHEEYDEDGFMTDNYNMDDWTYPLKKKNKKKKKIKLVIKEEEEEEELKCLGFRPQTRMGECAGCKAVCYECELLMIVETDEEYFRRIGGKKQ
tara:strand:+ start:686 stop:1096 length:411 start_codon:yes stop_codon:yes gene_type:complete